MTLTVLFPRATSIRPERSVTWDWSTIRERTYPLHYQSGSVMSQQRCIGNLSLALHCSGAGKRGICRARRVCKWLNTIRLRPGRAAATKNLELLKIVAWRAAVALSLTCRNSNYGTDCNAPVSAAFTKLHAWPSVCPLSLLSLRGK